MRLPIYQVDAFAAPNLRGNPAAVVPLEAWLPDETLQSIAEENNLSETAFVVPSGSSDGVQEFHLRWFTPTVEVPLCGHATLASAYVAFHNLGVAGEQVAFLTKSGRLEVTRDSDRLTLDFPAFRPVACGTPSLMIEALGSQPTACFATGHYLAVFESENAVRSLTPNFQQLAQLDLGDVMVTAPGDHADFVSRYFAPNNGINEDPVTGSAHSTAAPYWADVLGKADLVAQQVSRRGGLLHCNVRGDRVLIAGQVRPYLEGEITLSP